ARPKVPRDGRLPNRGDRPDRRDGRSAASRESRDGPRVLTATACRVAGYIDVNRANWDDRAAAHAASPDYAIERFIADPSFLSEVVTFDVPLLGDVRGLRGVHLQCHIGTDTISLARLGATVSGLAFSRAAIARAP